MLDTADKIFSSNPKLFKEVASETYDYEEFLQTLIEFADLRFIQYLPKEEKQKLYEYSKE